MKALKLDRRFVVARLTLAALACTTGIALATNGPPNGTGPIYLYFGTAPGLAPAGTPTGPNALITYESLWRVDATGTGTSSRIQAPTPGGAPVVAPAPVLRYCVFPSIGIFESRKSNPPGPPIPDWTTPFTLRLIHASGAATPTTYPPAPVSVPIPSGTTRLLLPEPWCGATAPGAALPELYLEVDGRPKARVRVIWAPAPVTPPSGRPTTNSTR